MTYFDFNSASEQTSFDLIPKGTLVRVRMTIRPGGFDDASQGWTGGYATRNDNTGSVYLNWVFLTWLPLSGGPGLVPDYTLDDAPPPAIVSVGAQRGSEAIEAWLRAQAERADLVMSVCTGAFLLGRAGLLDGKRATTHHLYWDPFAKAFPRVELVRGPRFVEDGKVLSAGGLTSGIDAALHVVGRYYGREMAQRTADYMEYEGRRWMERGT